MSDKRLRELERRAALGDARAAKALDRERRRSTVGRPCPERPGESCNVAPSSRQAYDPAGFGVLKPGVTVGGLRVAAIFECSNCGHVSACLLEVEQMQPSFLTPGFEWPMTTRPE